MSTEPPAPIPMPTAGQLRSRGLPPGILTACLTLTAHSINPDEIPRTEDALTDAGYLRTTGRILNGDTLETERIPWPDRTVWAELQPHLDAIRRNLRNEL